MDMPVNVPVDDPQADTEWNDILRQRGIIPPKPPSPTPAIQEALRAAREQAHEERLESKDLDELDKLEDVEDEAFLQQYREQRRAELRQVAQTSVYGHVFPLQKVDFTRDVTAASHQAFVLVHLTSSMGGNAESQLLSQLLRTLAERFGDVKFCEIRADMCIEGYPERNTPTLLVYRNGNISRQLVTLKDLAGLQTSTRDLEVLLVELGAVQPNDHRVLHSIGTTPRLAVSEEDSD